MYRVLRVAFIVSLLAPLAPGCSSSKGSGPVGQGGSDAGVPECPADYIEADGTPCAPDGKSCASGGGECEFGSFLNCENGVWVWREAFPNPACGDAGYDAGQ